MKITSNNTDNSQKALVIGDIMEAISNGYKWLLGLLFAAIIMIPFSGAAADYTLTITPTVSPVAENVGAATFDAKLTPAASSILAGDLIDETVVQQQTDRTGELCPDQIEQGLTLVEVHQLLQEALKYLLLGGAFLVTQVIGVSGIEGNPKEDEFSILILAPFRPVQPAERAMHAQCQVGGVILALRALSFLE